MWFSWFNKKLRKSKRSSWRKTKFNKNRIRIVYDYNETTIIERIRWRWRLGRWIVRLNDKRFISGGRQNGHFLIWNCWLCCGFKINRRACADKVNCAKRGKRWTLWSGNWWRRKCFGWETAIAIRSRILRSHFFYVSNLPINCFEKSTNRWIWNFRVSPPHLGPRFRSWQTKWTRPTKMLPADSA